MLVTKYLHLDMPVQ